jgi:hypothetical protein
MSIEDVSRGQAADDGGHNRPDPVKGRDRRRVVRSRTASRPTAATPETESR